jgi:hypothetical protein
MEDDLDALERVDGLKVLEVLGGGEDDALTRLVKKLAPLATNRISILREARELDRQVGLTPRAMADLRWKTFLTTSSLRRRCRTASRISTTADAGWPVRELIRARSHDRNRSLGWLANAWGRSKPSRTTSPPSLDGTTRARP